MTHAEAISLLAEKEAELVELRAENEALRNDSERIDFIERKARESYTGVSFDWTNLASEGRVVEKGYRMLWRHTINERRKDIRAAIDDAMKA